jgi:hypothetical protein
MHDELRARGWSDGPIGKELRTNVRKFDPKVVDALVACADDRRDAAIVSVLPSQLAIGMLIEQDVKTDQGVMLLSHGHEVTQPVLEHLRKFFDLGLLTKPMLVVPAGTKGQHDTQP